MWRPHLGVSWLPPPPDVANSESNSLLNPIYTDLWRNRQCSSEPRTLTRGEEIKREGHLTHIGALLVLRAAAQVSRDGAAAVRRCRRRRKRKRNLRVEVNNNGPELGSMRGPDVKWWAVKLSNLEPCWPRGKKISGFAISSRRWSFDFRCADPRKYPIIDRLRFYSNLKHRTLDLIESTLDVEMESSWCIITYIIYKYDIYIFNMKNTTVKKINITYITKMASRA